MSKQKSIRKNTGSSRSCCTFEYNSPLGMITVASDGDYITGLWFNGQRHFGNVLPENTEEKALPIFEDALRWLDIYFSGKNPIFCRRFATIQRRSENPCAISC